MGYHFKKIEKKILKDEYNSIVFKKGGARELYIVGGYLRDILRGVSSQDRDYILRNDIDNLVKFIKSQIGGTLVVFEKGNTKRIALKDGLTFDFSRISGSIEEDLSQRDYTINALAWSPHKGIIDFYHGIADIEKKIIRCISKENLIADPLRILRAYRFAAEINGVIERNTRKLLKILRSSIKEASPERITLEFFHLLNSRASAKYLKMALNDRVLGIILSIPNKVLENNVRVIYKFEKQTIDRIPRNFKVILYKTLSQNLTFKGLLCLQMLLRGYEFHDNIFKYLKISNRIMKRIKLSHKGLKILRENKRRSKRIYDFFLNSKETSVDIILSEGILELLKDYRKFSRIWHKSLLKTEEIIKITGIKEGSKLGMIIKSLKKEQFEGRICSKKSAIEFVNHKKDTIII